MNSRTAMVLAMIGAASLGGRLSRYERQRYTLLHAKWAKRRKARKARKRRSNP